MNLNYNLFVTDYALALHFGVSAEALCRAITLEAVQLVSNLTTLARDDTRLTKAGHRMRQIKGKCRLSDIGMGRLVKLIRQRN
jgi:hypothetical protein